MKRILAILVLGALALGARAQGSIPLLDKVKGHRVTFHYTYSLSRNGDGFAPVTSGNVTVEGNAYILQGLGMEVISDGTTRWTLDREAKEAMVEKVAKEDLFTNPALFIASYKDYMDRIQVNSSGSDSLDVTLTLDTETKARFVLKDIVYGPRKGKSDFSLTEKSLPDYLITDLR
jgi:hypothetical protein